MGRSFRPVVCQLEGRLVMAGGGTLSTLGRVLPPSARPVGAAGIDAPPISTVPVPGDSPLPKGVPLAIWLQLHQRFMSRARRQHDDVVFLGDSMIEGWLGAGRRVWNSQIAPLHAAAFGIHGDETQNVLWRVLNGELSGRPRVAVVLVGFNNLSKGQSVGETVAGITAVVNAVQKVSPRTKVLLLGVFPSGPEPGTPARAAIEQVNASISRLAGGPVTYLDIGRQFLQPDGAISPAILSGYVHPTEAGYQIFADAIRGTLRGMLRR